MMVMAFGNGVAQPSAIAAAVSVRPGLAGTASGLVGALQMGFGALMTVAAGATEDGRGGATVACMLLCAVGHAGVPAGRAAAGAGRAAVRTAR
jgi:DHA1 family bicyclomycin/chloramphenicol resistance-like MFS transporter